MQLSSDAMLDDLGDMYETWRAEHGPVVPIELDGGVQAFLVIGHREVQEVGRNEALYTPDSRTWRELRNGRVPDTWPLLPQIIFQVGNPRFLSGPAHTRLRSLMSSGLNEVEGQRTRRFVEWVADRLIDRFAPGGRADAVADYAAPLPMLVMLRLMGLPHEAGEDLLPAIFQLLEGGPGAQKANEAIHEILSELVAARRAKPERDFASWAIHGPVVNGPALSDLEVTNLIWVATMAGAGGTAGWIANVLEQIVCGEELYSLYLAGKASIAEIMNTTHRTNPAVQNVMGRFPLRDLAAGELGNYPIPSGALLVLGLAGASADPHATGGAPSRTYDLGNEYHWAFGTGAHECPTGAQRLAHTITQSAIDRFVARCRNMQLEDDQSVDWGGSVILRQLRSMRVVFTPAEHNAVPLEVAGTALSEGRSSHALFPPRMLTKLTSDPAH
ncbi:hypothetical protein ABZ016_13640 [Streptomyces sp. NPDC006372]|uniref:hypothetical protein n=1 Tax=Streptomyces sp. NPDC006372 TaxID=3155599 RepID=UPI0033A96160